MTPNEYLNILVTRLEDNALKVFEEATSQYHDNYREIKTHMLEKLGQTDIKREQFFPPIDKRGREA